MPYRLYLLLGLFFIDVFCLSLFRGAFLTAFAPTTPLPFDATVIALLMGIRFDIKMLAFLYVPFFLLAFLPYVTTIKQPLWQKYLWVTLSFLFSLSLVTLFAIDASYYAYLKTRLSTEIFILMQDAQLAWNFATRSYPLFWLVLGTVLIACVVTAGKFWWQFQHVHRVYAAPKTSSVMTLPKRIRIRNALIALTYFLLSFGLWVLGGHGSTTPVGLNWSAVRKLSPLFLQELAYNPAIKVFDGYGKKLPSISSKEIQAVAPWLNSQYGSGSKPAVAISTPNMPELNLKGLFRHPIEPADTKLPPQLNVVLVIMESYSAQRTGIFGNALKASPEFDRIAQEGILFSRFFSSGVITMRGVFSSLTGIPDTTNDWATATPGLQQQSSPINLFTSHQKLYFIGGDVAWAGLGGFLFATIPHIQIYERSAFSQPRVNSWGISDRHLFLETNKILAQQKKPFFAIIQTAHNHRPYGIEPEDLAQLPTKIPNLETLRQNGFNSEIEFRAWQNHDYALGVWLRDLRAQAWADNTLFVFVGDHGVAYDIPAQAHNAIVKNGLQQFHIPMLLWSPKWLRPGINTRIGSQPDVMPTIAGLMGYGGYGGYGDYGGKETSVIAPSLIGKNLLDPHSTANQALILLSGAQEKLGLVTSNFFAQGLRRQLESSIQLSPLNWEAMSTTSQSVPASAARPMTEHDKTFAKNAMTALDTAALWLIQENPKSNFGAP